MPKDSKLLGRGLKGLASFHSGPGCPGPPSTKPAPILHKPKWPPPSPATPVNWEKGKASVLIIGGGSSHKFHEFFGKADSATLEAAGLTTHYTEDNDQAIEELANADVAIISVNRTGFDTPEYRKALMDRIDAGKGVIMLHPGTWYGYRIGPN